MILTIVAIVLLLLGSAFFSGSETALTSASKPLMHHLAREGDKGAALVNTLYAQKERLLGTILLGNTLVNILCSSLATSLFIGLFGDTGVVYATVTVTILVLIFGEIIPKTYALHRANSVAPVLATPVRVVVILLFPLVVSLNAVVRAIMFILGHRQMVISSDMAEAELRGAIDLHAAASPPDEIHNERAMLRSILDLNDVSVSEIMTYRKEVVMVNIDQPAEDIIDQSLAGSFTRIPLWKDQPDNIVGVLHVKALLRAMREEENLEQLDVLSLASSPWFIPESTLLTDQLQAFRDRREHFALVVDEYGTFLGVVTLEDILEEIVGDISDEHDTVVPGVRPQPDGSYIVDGKVTIRDLNREFDWHLPDEEAATIAGLIMYESRQIPQVGQSFLFYGFRFEVLRRQRNHVASIRITPPSEVS